MTSREAVNWLINITADIGKHEHQELWHYEQALSEIREMLENAQPEQRWIPVTERLPEEDMDVLVTVYFKGLKQTHSNGWNDHINPSHYVEVASRLDDEWNSYSDEYKVARSRHEVIAWMPLPEPYQEEGEK